MLANSDVLEEQRLRANFEVNIYDKEKADRFVKIFGKMNGSNFRPARMAKRRQGFIGSSFICCRKVRDKRSSEVANGPVNVGHWPRKAERN